MFKLLILSILGLFATCSQPIQVDRSELRDIYSLILTKGATEGRQYLIDSIENFDEKSMTFSDTTYHIAIYENVKDGIWGDDLFDSLNLISEAELDLISQRDPFTLTPSHYRLSLPYYSEDKKSFLISYDYYCGNLCAEYSLRLYRKINGKWTYVKSYFTILS